MSGLQRLARLFSPGKPRDQRVLEGFVDSLLQSFENYRAGLGDEMLRGPESKLADYFLELYQKEAGRLPSVVDLACAHLSKQARQEMRRKTDELIRRVVIPAYARLTQRFTRRERNDFYLTAEALHGVERIGWAVAGILLGSFVVWAPFIPLWSKEWVLVFALGGLVFPNIRRVLALRRYVSELNGLVGRTDDEIWRLDLGYMTSEQAAALSTSAEAEGEDRLTARLAEAEGQAETPPPAQKPVVRGGGR